MIALAITAVVFGVFGICLMYVVWTLDHNPHGSAPEKDWKENYDD